MEPRIRRLELAKQLNVSTRTLDRWVQDGVYGVKLRAIRLGRTVGFLLGDVDAFRKLVDARRGKSA